MEGKRSFLSWFPSSLFSFLFFFSFLETSPSLFPFSFCRFWVLLILDSVGEGPLRMSL